LKTFRGRRASLLYQILLGAWRSKSTLEIDSTIEIRSITKIYNFRRAPVVGVPIAEVANTLASGLRWMVSSSADRLDTKTTFLRSACLST
jgi:hypothetical protein